MIRAALACLAALSGGADLRAEAPPVTPVSGGRIDFARDVAPVLSEYCYACHGPDEKSRKADLRLDTQDDLFRKDSPLVVPGKSAESELVRRVTCDDPSEIMPPPRSKKPVPPAQVEVLKRWVDQGAVWGKHWAFEPPARPKLPGEVHPIDELVGRRLAAEGRRLGPEADKRTLIRRVTLDLTGLPPTPAEVAAFLSDDKPGAFERVVDRLLSSPRYGERMVFEWLAAARYADTNGYQGDGERTMWPWRDWAVRAFNADMPYDRFTVNQLAGDLVAGATDETRLATGFLRNHAINGEGGRIPEENRIDYAMDMAETVGTVWLGLTMNCCRCHDHKFDPLKQSEYYGLMAFFNQTRVDGSGGDPQTPPVLEVATPAQKGELTLATDRLNAASKRVEALEAKRFPKGASAKWPGELKDALQKSPRYREGKTLDRLAEHLAADAEYAQALAELRPAIGAESKARRAIPRVMVMADMEKPRETFILDKGGYTKPLAKVEALVPSAVGKLKAGARPDRLALAEWVVAPENPLTARVAVNRFWSQVFGQGLVKTSEDFGVQSERPAHPELLDYLACEFARPADPAAPAWSVKRLMRLIVTSGVYKQSSAATPEALERDPSNRMLARGPRFRLSAWAIRDSALAASGLLVDKQGGEPVMGYHAPGVWEEATFGQKQYKQGHGDDLYRRSVYLFWRRIVTPTVLFDTPSRLSCSVKSGRTNTPLHALTTLNEVTYVEAARALAERVLTTTSDDDARLTLACERVLSRAPSEAERAVLRRALAKYRAAFKADSASAAKLLAVGESRRATAVAEAEHAAWAALCGVILNLDEALTKE